MSEPERKCDKETIKKLIEAQEKTALSRFRSSHFRERLEIRIQTARTRSSRPSFLHAIPAPVWVSLAFLALLGGALLMRRFFLTPGPKASTTIERFLRQLPAMQALESRSPALSGPEAVRPSLLEKLMADALASPALSAKTLPNPESHELVSPHAKPAGPQGLREIYDILLIDKSVERVLTAVYEK